MDVNIIFRGFFSYFDETKCQWKTEEDLCDDLVTDTDDTDSGQDTDSDTDSDTESDNIDTNDTGTDTNDDDSDAINDDNVSNDDTTDSTDSNDPGPDTTDVPETTTEKPYYQTLECEPLDETWMCSSGSRNHSLCIKFCTQD